MLLAAAAAAAYGPALLPASHPVRSWAARRRAALLLALSATRAAWVAACMAGLVRQPDAFVHFTGSWPAVLAMGTMEPLWYQVRPFTCLAPLRPPYEFWEELLGAHNYGPL